MISVRHILAFCAILVMSQPSFGASGQPDGRKIYRQLCVKCHGKNGEGVKGKYDEALQGDWSIEKLTRVIDKTMPDDNPKKCVGIEAEAVARYIHRTFYSREARARLHPPRIELARLTNLQYQNSLADLFKEFTGHDQAMGAERGLEAAYYKSRNFRNNQKLTNRIDSQIDFDFAKVGPEQTPLGTNELSVQWRGSLIAPETGNYEFVVRTANGMRLWLNEETDPLLDAWVASGDLTEHKAIVKLIGGRAYPLRLDYFIFKDKTASIALLWRPPHGVEEVIPARNLTTTRTSSTYVTDVPFPADDSSVGYERGVSVSKEWDEAATQAAIAAANHVVRRLDQFSKSKAADTNRNAKVETFLNEFVAAAFRQPLSPEQKKRFVSSHLKSAPNVDEGVKRVVLLSLKSPRFLYPDLGAQENPEFSIASRLSFALWDSVPDKSLLEKAARKELHTETQLASAVAEILKDPRTSAKLHQFLERWLQMNRAEDLSKDTTLFPGFTPQVIADLRASLNIFLDEVVASSTADYRELLRADYLIVNDRLAAFYGFPTNGSPEFRKVKVSSSQRSGVLTHPYLLAEFSYPRFSSPIHRGVFLTRNIVGRALRPPPMAVVFKDADFDPSLTMREKVSELTKSQACQGCHSVINPLGFALENYDAVGRFRTEEKGRIINALSEYMTDDGKTVKLEGARDIAAFAIQDPQAVQGFVEQLFHHLVKQPLLAYGSEVPARLRDSFISSGYNMRKLMGEIAVLTARRVPEKATKST